MNNKISYEEAQKLTHLKLTKEDIIDRFIPLFAAYDNEWKAFLNSEKGLININIVNMVSGLYFAKEPVEDIDLKFDFFNFMIKRNNFIVNSAFIYHILEDIKNLSASVEKLNFFSLLHDKEENAKLCKYASVELESIFQNSRAILEMLQKIQNNLISITQSIDGSDLFTEKKVQYDNMEKLTIEEFMKKYKVPKELAVFYVNTHDFFFFILNTRNDIIHNRINFDIYLGKEGFSISINNYGLKSLHIWNETNTLKNNLGSIKSLAAYIVLNTIHILEEYQKVISSTIKLPDDISPEYALYFRSEFNNTLTELHTYVDKHAWSSTNDI